jgi:hypothetical protein
MSWGKIGAKTRVFHGRDGRAGERSHVTADDRDSRSKRSPNQEVGYPPVPGVAASAGHGRYLGDGGLVVEEARQRSGAAAGWFRPFSAVLRSVIGWRAGRSVYFIGELALPPTRCVVPACR